MEKNIDYYMKLPYTRELSLGSDGLWFIQIKELPGCFSQGTTPEEALRMIDDAMLGWLEVELEDGEIIPEPRPEEDYSGKFNTRVPKSLHRKLVDAADRDGVSLNQWINSALAEAVGSSFKVNSTIKTHSEVSGKPDSWQDLSNGVRNILTDVGSGVNYDVSDEVNFSNWLGQSFLDCFSDCENQSYEQAFTRSKALTLLLSKYRQASPLLDCIYLFAENQTKILDQVCSLNEDVQSERQINQKINEFLTSSPRKTTKGRQIDILEADYYQVREQVEHYKFG